jgi:catechol 2,3-dioxygenase-like lactoylglutathione lyase family enzyme
MSNQLPSLGIRHIALNVKDPQASKAFYMRVLKMDLEWEPDSDNVYLTTQSKDNLALHRAPASPSTGQTLDHFGFMLPKPEDVDTWYAQIQKEKAKIVREIKTHRDGARSFYFQDPDGITIQMIFHPPISRQGS